MNAKVILATETETVAFTPLKCGERVLVARKTSSNDPAVIARGFSREHLTVEKARRLYRRLLESGYWVW